MYILCCTFQLDKVSDQRIFQREQRQTLVVMLEEEVVMIINIDRFHPFIVHKGP